MILIHFFHIQTLIGVKMLLFLEQTIGDGIRQGLGDTTITTETIYSLNFSRSNFYLLTPQKYIS